MKKTDMTIKQLENLLEDWKKRIEPCYTEEWKDPKELNNSYDLQLLAAMKHGFVQLLEFKKENL